MKHIKRMTDGRLVKLSLTKSKETATNQNTVVSPKAVIPFKVSNFQSEKRKTSTAGVDLSQKLRTEKRKSNNLMAANLSTQTLKRMSQNLKSGSQVMAVIKKGTTVALDSSRLRDSSNEIRRPKVVNY